MSRSIISRIAVAFLVCGILPFSSAPIEAPEANLVNGGEVRSQIRKIRVPFLANEGQVDENVEFYARTFGGTTYIGKDGAIVYAIPGRAGGEAPGIGVVKETFVGGRPDHIEGEDKSSTKVNDYRGQDRSKWKTSIPSYETVSLGEVYENIRVKVKARGSSVEKLFFVQPGGKPDDIRIRVTGAKSLHVREDGQLEAATEWGTTGFSKPVAFQYKAGGEKEFVRIAYAVQDNEYGFKAGKYDSSRTLVIDPLLSSTFVGGLDNESIGSIVVSGTSVYVAGCTRSTDFPMSTGVIRYTDDAFVAKLSGGLTRIDTVTFLGGSENDSARAIAASGGYVYVTGNTRSYDFPVDLWPYGSTPNSYNQDVFVAELDRDLALGTTRLVGGTGDETATSMAVDDGGNVFVAGYTASGNFPLGTGVESHGETGGTDVFVSRLGGGLVAETYSATLVGGTSQDQAHAMAVHSLNGVYVAGSTSSSGFPATSPAYDNSHNGGDDAFVINLTGDLQTLNRSTFLGGTGSDRATALVLDSGGNVLVSGQTDSPGFPTPTGQYGTSPLAGGAAFVSRLNPDLDELGASVIMGGAASDSASSLALDSNGNIYVAGSTYSSDFPATTGSYAPRSRGGRDGFVAKLNANLTPLAALSASTYLGGSGEDHAAAMALDSSGYVYLAGFTGSPDFLNGYDVTGGPWYAGGTDGFVAKLDSSLSGSPWPMFLHDLAHTGRSSFSGPVAPGLKWSVDGSLWAVGGTTYLRSSTAVGPNGNVVAAAGWYVVNITPGGDIRGMYSGSAGAIESSPAIAPDGTVYVGSDDGYLHAINPDYTQKWAFPTGGAIKASPVIGPDGTVYVGSDDGNVYAVQSDGTSKWTDPFTTGGAVRSSPAIGPDGIVYVGSDDSNVYAIQPGGGTYWEIPFATEGPVRSSPVGDVAGTVGYVGSQDGTLYAIDPSSGNLLWSYKTGGPIETSAALAADAGGTVYVGSRDGYLYALRQVVGTSTGTVLWRSLIYPFMSSPAIGSDGTIYVRSFDNRVHALNPSDGSELWSYQTGLSAWPTTRPAVGTSGIPAGETVFVGSNDNLLYALNAGDGSVKWSKETTGWVTHHSVQGTDGTLYVAASDGTLHAVNPGTGDIKWSHNADAPIVNSIPVIALDGTIFLLDDYGYLHLINPADGSEMWTFYTFASWGSSPPPVDSNNTIHIVSSANQVIGIKTDGSQHGYYSSNESIRSIGLEGGITYLGCDTGIFAVNSSLEQLAWSYTAGSVSRIVTSSGGFVYAVAADSSSTPAVYTLYSFNPDGPANPQGAVKWSHATTVPIDSLTVGSDGAPYFSTANGVFALNPADGALRWSILAEGAASLHPGSDGNLYFGAEDQGEKVFYAVDPATGLEKWPHVNTGMYVSAAPAIGSDGTVYVETDGKELYAINDGSVLWRFLRGPWIVSSPSIGPDQTLYAGAEDANIYALSDAHLSVDPSPYDFGDVPVYTSSALVAIALTNTGAKDITVSWLDVTSSGGGYELTSYSTGDPEPCYLITLSPDESCTTSVTFSPASMGRSEGTLSIYTNDLLNPYEVLLTGRGVKPVFSLDPTSFDFGDVTIGEIASTTVTLSNTGNSDLTVETMSFSGDGFFSRVGGTCGDPTAVIGPDGNCTVIVEFAPQEVGTGYYAYMAAATNDPDNPDLYAEFWGNGYAAPQPSISISPDISTGHGFGTTKVNGSSNVLSLTISNNGNADLSVASISLADTANFALDLGSCGSASPVIQPAESCAVGIQFTPKSAGQIDTTLTIQSNDPVQSSISAPLSGWAVNPAISVDPNTDGIFDFGPVAPGSSRSQYFWVMNIGEVDLAVSGVSLSGADFTVNESSSDCPVAPFTLAPWSYCGVEVVFDPQSSGLLTGTLSVSSDDSAHSPFVIELLGTGSQFLLEIGLETLGGAVTSNPAGIDCSDPDYDCEESFDSGAVVSLTAVPDAGYRFVEWGYDLSGSDETASVLMDGDKYVTASFVAQYFLTIRVTPETFPAAGYLNISKRAPGSEVFVPDDQVPVDYAYQYDQSTEVRLEAVPEEGFKFDHWELDEYGSRSDNPTVLYIYESQSITAVFKPIEVLVDVNATADSCSEQFYVLGISCFDNIHAGVHGVADGGTVTVAPGLYTTADQGGKEPGEEIQLTKNITISGDAQDKPVLRGASESYYWTAFYFASCSDQVVVENLVIEGFEYGLYSTYCSSTIRHNEFRDGYAGVYAGGYPDRVTRIEDNVFSDEQYAIQVELGPSSTADSVVANNLITGAQGGIYLYGYGYDNESASVYQNTLQGDGSGGWGIQTYDANARIERNEIRGFYGGMFVEQLESSTTSSEIVNNLITGVYLGIELYGNDSPKVYHNTVDGQHGLVWYWYWGGYGIWIDEGTPEIKYNIVTNFPYAGIYVAEYRTATDPISIEYNDVWNNGEQSSDQNYVNCVPTEGGGNISEDPLYGTDLLQLDSPCINAIPADSGDPVTTDLDGNVRPWPAGSGFDMGAHESLGTGSVVYVKPVATGMETGDSWENATDLQSALSSGGARVGDEIWVAAGTYLPGDQRTDTFQLQPGVALYGGFVGDGSETSRGQRNWRLHPTILAGDVNGDDGPDFANREDNVYHVVTGADKAILDGFTITGGSVVDGDNTTGGGMYNPEGISVTVANCIFSGNEAYWGGGMYNGRNSRVWVTNCVFSDNQATSGGGGVRNSDGSLVIIKNGVFHRNSVRLSDQPSNGGGAIENKGSGYLVTVQNCTFFESSVVSESDGPVLYNGQADEPARDSAVWVMNCIFWGNFASGGANIVSDGNQTEASDPTVYVSIGYSDIEDNGTNVISFEDRNGSSTGSYGTIYNMDPVFVHPADPDGADNLWATADDGLRLDATSPCSDQGENTGALGQDLIGIARFQIEEDGTRNKAEMGAYERLTGVNAGVLVSPDGHDFGVVRLGESSSQEFTIFNTGTSQLNVSGLGLLYGDSSSFTLNVNGGSKPCGTTSPSLPPAEPDNYCTVEVAFSPQDAWYGDYDFLVMSTNDPEQPVVEVYLSGEGGQSEIDVYIDEDRYWWEGYDFGEVHAGSGSSRDFVIFNYGSVDLNISDISFAGTGMETLSWSGDWCVHPEGCVIGPYSEQTVTVTFAQPSPPIRLGYDDSVALNIVSDDGYGNDSLSIPLWGRPFELTLSVSLEGDTTCGASVTSDPGSIACDVDGAACADTFDEGAIVSLTAASQDPECRFDHWVVGSTQPTANPLAVTMTRDTSVSAVFVRSVGPPEYNLTTEVSPSGAGTVTLSPPGGTYESDEVVTVTANAGAQYVFDHWEGAVTGSANPATVTMNGDKTVRAVFVSKQFTLTTEVSPSGAGTVTLSPPGGTYESGAVVTVTANAGAQYVFDHWEEAVTGTTNPATVTMDSNKTVRAVLVSRQYALTASAKPGEGGSVSLYPAGGVYDAGTSVTVTATPAEGYRFDRWTGDLDGQTNPASVTMNADKKVAAVFVRQRTLTTRARPEQGGSVSLNPAGGVYDAKTTVTVTATPAEGYRFVRWAGDLKGKVNPASITMDGEKGVAALFVRQFTLTARANPDEGGSVSFDPEGGVYDARTTVMVTATPAVGYRFVRWAGDLDGDTNPASITMNGNKKVAAVFVRQFALEASAKPEEGGAVSLDPAGGTYDALTIVSVTATPAEGYRFVRWAGDLDGDTNPASITMNGNKKVAAVFVRQFALTATAKPREGGSVSLTPPGGLYDLNTTVTLRAVPAEGYRFVNWTGDLTGTDRPATLVMDGDKSVEAVFTVKEASVTIHMPAASATEPKEKAYRMIGIPVMPADRDTFRALKAKLGASYDLSEWRLFRSVRGKLKVIDGEGQDAIRYGKGWWMVCEDAKDITLRGLPLLTDFRTSLASDYNIVACPFQDRKVKWSDVLNDMDDSGVNLGAILYYYTGGSENDGYEAASEMEPGKAYMVWSKAGGILHIKRNYAGSPARKAMRSSGFSEQPLPPPPSGATVPE